MPTAPAAVDVDKLIGQVERASPMARVLQKALAVINDTNSDADQIARVIQFDEALAGLVLRLANSAYFSPAQRISSVKRAVAYVGLVQLKQLLLPMATASFLDAALPAYRLDRGQLWSHAIGMAVGARYLAASHSVVVAEAAYTAGLLADVGLRVFDPVLQTLPAAAGQVPTLAIERACLGLDHARLGAMIARRWRLPEMVIDAIEHHHAPMQAGAGTNVAAALHLVDTCLAQRGDGFTAAAQPDPAALQAYRLDEPRYARLYDAIQPLLRTARVSFGL